MSSELYRKVKEIFLAVRSAPLEERPVLLRDSEFRWVDRHVSVRSGSDSMNPCVLLSLEVEDGHIEHTHWLVRDGKQWMTACEHIALLDQ